MGTIRMKMVGGEMLALAGGIAFSPIPIAAVILILMTPQGRRNSLAFVIGWLLGLSALLLSVILVVGRIDAAGNPRFPWIGPSSKCCLDCSCRSRFSNLAEPTSGEEVRRPGGWRNSINSDGRSL